MTALAQPTSQNAHITLAVVVPVFNTEKYLDEFFNALQNQTFSDFHAYIVDDGSTDNSLAYLKSKAQTDSRIRLFTQTNQGASAARNHALDEIKNSHIHYEYLYLVDSDDYFETDVFEKAISGLNRSCADICFFSIRNITKDGLDAPAEKQKERKLNHDDIVNLYFGINKKYRKNKACNRFLNNKIFRYSAVNQIRFDTNQKKSNDFEFFLRVLPHLKTGYLVPSVHYIYRKRKSSIGNTVKQPGNLVACLKNWPSMKDRSELEQRYIQHYFIRAIYETSGSYIIEDNPAYQKVEETFKETRFFKKFIFYDLKPFIVLSLPRFVQKYFFKKRMRRVLKKRAEERNSYFD